MASAPARVRARWAALLAPLAVAVLVAAHWLLSSTGATGVLAAEDAPGVVAEAHTLQPERYFELESDANFSCEHDVLRLKEDEVSGKRATHCTVACSQRLWLLDTALYVYGRVYSLCLLEPFWALKKAWALGIGLTVELDLVHNRTYHYFVFAFVLTGVPHLCIYGLIQCVACLAQCRMDVGANFGFFVMAVVVVFTLYAPPLTVSMLATPFLLVGSLVNPFVAIFAWYLGQLATAILGPAYFLWHYCQDGEVVTILCMKALVANHFQPFPHLLGPAAGAATLACGALLFIAKWASQRERRDFLPGESSPLEEELARIGDDLIHKENSLCVIGMQTWRLDAKTNVNAVTGHARTWRTWFEDAPWAELTFNASPASEGVSYASLGSHLQKHVDFDVRIREVSAGISLTVTGIPLDSLDDVHIKLASRVRRTATVTGNPGADHITVKAALNLCAQELREGALAEANAGPTANRLRTAVEWHPPGRGVIQIFAEHDPDIDVNESLHDIGYLLRECWHEQHIGEASRNAFMQVASQLPERLRKAEDRFAKLLDGEVCNCCRAGRRKLRSQAAAEVARLKELVRRAHLWAAPHGVQFAVIGCSPPAFHPLDELMPDWECSAIKLFVHGPVSQAPTSRNDLVKFMRDNIGSNRCALTYRRTFKARVLQVPNELAWKIPLACSILVVLISGVLGYKLAGGFVQALPGVPLTAWVGGIIGALLGLLAVSRPGVQSVLKAGAEGWAYAQLLLPTVDNYSDTAQSINFVRLGQPFYCIANFYGITWNVLLGIVSNRPRNASMLWAAFDVLGRFFQADVIEASWQAFACGEKTHLFYEKELIQVKTETVYNLAVTLYSLMHSHDVDISPPRFLVGAPLVLQFLFCFVFVIGEVGLLNSLLLSLMSVYSGLGVGAHRLQQLEKNVLGETPPPATLVGYRLLESVSFFASLAVASLHLLNRHIYAWMVLVTFLAFWGIWHEYAKTTWLWSWSHESPLLCGAALLVFSITWPINPGTFIWPPLQPIVEGDEWEYNVDFKAFCGVRIVFFWSLWVWLCAHYSWTGIICSSLEEADLTCVVKTCIIFAAACSTLALPVLVFLYPLARGRSCEQVPDEDRQALLELPPGFGCEGEAGI